MQNLAEPSPRSRPLPDWNVKSPTADSLSSVVLALENELTVPPTVRPSVYDKQDFKWQKTALGTLGKGHRPQAYSDPVRQSTP